MTATAHAAAIQLLTKAHEITIEQPFDQHAAVNDIIDLAETIPGKMIDENDDCYEADRFCYFLIEATRRSQHSNESPREMTLPQVISLVSVLRMMIEADSQEEG